MPMRSRPGLVTAIGVISVVLGALGILSGGCGSIQSLGFLMMGRVTTLSGPGAVTVSGPAALTAGEVQAVMAAVQAKANGPLTAAQVAEFQKRLGDPRQTMVAPASQGMAAGSQVSSALVHADGSAQVVFASGATLMISPQANTVSQTSAMAMPVLNISRAAVLLSMTMALGGLGLAVYLLVIGIMVLRDSPRGVRLHWIYVWVKIPLAIVGGVGMAWMMSTIMPVTPGTGRAPAGVIFSVMALTQIALGSAYPVGLIFALRSRSVRAYVGAEASAV